MNYYEILDCNPNATYQQIKRSYQRLVKSAHPDKLGVLVEDKSQFLQIDKAWKVLRDETQRKIYDSLLLQEKLHQESVIYAELSLNNLHFNQDNIAEYICRCGELFTISKEDFTGSGEEVLYECSECSNNILVKS